MRKLLTAVSAFALTLAALAAAPARLEAQQGGAGPVALTIYNQDFAVARTTVDLNLAAGMNQVTTSNVTSMLEPDSVVLRDPSGRASFAITEQNYDAGVIDQPSMLQKFEGKTIRFQRIGDDGKPVIVEGRILRAGAQPLIETGGVMQFQLPGTPLFPASTDGLLLKPTLRWQISAPRAVHLSAELAYITHGLTWQATYNVVAPPDSAQPKDAAPERVDLLGWVTIQNHTGTDFPQAAIKLMAGDVAKIRNLNQSVAVSGVMDGIGMGSGFGPVPAVTQQAFDDFHLYDLNRTVSLASGETKQVQFLTAAQVAMERVYEYDGAAIQAIQAIANCSNCLNTGQGFGLGPNTKVFARAEIKNSTANHLGMPLPAGRIRLYRRDPSGQMEFIGEGAIPHTPAEETVKVPVGSAFDVTGERKQTDFHIESGNRTIDESFAITVKNQKTVPVKVAIVEHMYRAASWQITSQSLAQGAVQPGPAPAYTKRDSSTVEFPVTVPPAGQITLNYTVHYTW